MLSSDPLVLFPFLVVLYTGVLYLAKAGVGYIIWHASGRTTTPPQEIRDMIGPGEPVRLQELDRAVATRFSTWPPRWLVSTTAVERLPPTAQECLITHIQTHVASHGRLLHNASVGVGLAIVVSVVRLQTPRVGPMLLGALAFVILYFTVLMPVLERWLVYRADVRAATACGIETYRDFLDILAETNPASSRLRRFVEPTPQARRRYLDRKLQ